MTLIACACVLLGVIFLALFYIFRMPDASMEGPVANGERLQPRHGAVVVVLRWVRKDALAVGDLVVAEGDSAGSSQRVVRSVIAIAEPDPSQMNSGGRRTSGRVIADRIRAMDLERTFTVADRSGTNTWKVPTRRVVGKVMIAF